MSHGHTVPMRTSTVSSTSELVTDPPAQPPIDDHHIAYCVVMASLGVTDPLEALTVQELARAGELFKEGSTDKTFLDGATAQLISKLLTDTTPAPPPSKFKEQQGRYTWMGRGANGERLA